MNQEEVFRNQLAEEKAERKKIKTTPPAKKAGALRKLLKNPIVQLSIPFLGEAGSGGILPGWTGSFG